MNQLSNTLKRLMKVGAILFGLAFIVSGVIGILYNPNVPEGIVLPGKPIWFIFIIAGAVVAAVASVLLVRDLRNR